MRHIKIYTDGSCVGNGIPNEGFGGWGCVLQHEDGRVKELSGRVNDTTNNRMELMAVIQALGFLKTPACIDLYTDSKYVQMGISQWIRNWKRNRWRSSSGDSVKNRDLWEELDTACSKHKIQFHWVKGHAGNPGNERADELARGM